MKIKSAGRDWSFNKKGKAPLFSTVNEVRPSTLNTVSNREAFPFLLLMYKKFGGQQTLRLVFSEFWSFSLTRLNQLPDYKTNITKVYDKYKNND